MATEEAELVTTGLHPNVPEPVYRAWPYASQSILKILRDHSPAHAKEAMDNPPEPTPALMLGSAIHAAVLQPDLFSEHYTIAPVIDRRTKAGKDEWAAFEAENAGKTVLKRDEWLTCLQVRTAVDAHPTARRLLAGNAEQSAVWQDKDTGVWCKGRFDQTAPLIGALTDLKTTRDASPRAFTRAIYNYGYYMQAAHYLAGAQALGIDAKFFTIIAVEKEPPYAVAVYHITGDAIQAGTDELKPLLGVYARCVQTGVWPGYPNEAVEIDLPTYAYYQIGERRGDE